MSQEFADFAREWFGFPSNFNQTTPKDQETLTRFARDARTFFLEQYPGMTEEEVATQFPRVLARWFGTTANCATIKNILSDDLGRTVRISPEIISALWKRLEPFKGADLKLVRTTSAASSSSVSSDFICNISKSCVKEPVRSPRGHLYDRSQIVRWLQSDGRSPMTRQPVRIEELLFDFELYDRLQNRQNAPTASAREQNIAGANGEEHVSAVVETNTEAVTAVGQQEDTIEESDVIADMMDNLSLHTESSSSSTMNIEDLDEIARYTNHIKMLTNEINHLKAQRQEHLNTAEQFKNSAQQFKVAAADKQRHVKELFRHVKEIQDRYY